MEHTFQSPLTGLFTHNPISLAAIAASYYPAAPYQGLMIVLLSAEMLRNTMSSQRLYDQRVSLVADLPRAAVPS